MHGRHAAHHSPLRRRGEPEGQEDRYDLGLQPLLRQAPLRASGRHRPVEEVAKANAAKTGGSFTKTNSMAEAFKDADIVYPKSWAPFAAMEKRTNLYAEGDADGIKALEKELLAQNADHKDWCCTEELMKTTKDGKALYLHCLPADINDVSCKDGEVEASVFDRYRTPLYKEASYKPYIIAAMIFLAKVKNPQATLKALEERGIARWFQK